MPYTAGFAAGDVLTAANMNSIGEAWTTYTPTWSVYLGTTTLGNGTLTGRYLVLNKLVFGHIKLSWGTTTSTSGAGAANPFLFSTPSTYDINSNFGTRTPIGTALIEDSGATIYVGTVVVTSSTTIGIQTPQYNSGISLLYSDYVAKDLPFTWGSTDAVTLTFCYERA